MAAVPAEVRGALGASGQMEMPDGWQDLVDQLRDELLKKVKDGLTKLAQEERKGAVQGSQAGRTCIRCAKPIGATHRFCQVCGAEQPRDGAVPS
jgi:hypothetical protein